MKDKDASYQARSITIRLGLAAAVLLSVLLLSPPVRLFERGEGLWLGLHLMLEVSAVVVAALVVAVSWYSLERAQRRQSNALIFGFTVTAICDLLHALSYAGMPALLSESSTSKAIYFWLAARIFETLALALLAVNLRLPGAAWRWFVGAIGVALGIFWVLTWHPGHLPAVYVPEYGLTTFKVFVEYALCLANLAIAVTFWGAGQRTGRSRGFWLAGACFVMALGEVAFASYHAPEDSLNVLGHVFKVLADWLIFRAVFAINIRQPYDLVRRAEASLRDREVQLAALARNIPNGLLFQLERDQQGHHRFVYVSDAVHREGSLNMADVLRDPMLLYGRLLPEDLALLRAAETESASSMSVLDVVVRMPGKQGELRWLRICSAPRLLEDGRLMWDGLVLDITREKRDEQAQRSHEAVLRTMVDNMPFEAWVRDEQERLVLENPARVAHFGSQLGLVPAQCTDRPEEQARWARYNARAWQGEVIEYEMDTLVQGRMRSFLCIVAPLRQGDEVRGLVGFNIDVTPRKEAERRAHEKDAQLASILMQMPGGVSRLDRDLRFQFVNEAHASWFGHSVEAMRGQPLSAIVSPERLQRMLPFVRRTLAGELVVFENRVELPSGQVRYRHTTLAPERGADGSVVGFIAFAVDTTERKTMELALEQNQTRLRALVNALPDMVFLKDAEGRYQYCNPVFEKFAGRGEAGIVGLTDEQLFSPEAAHHYRARDLELLKSRQPTIYEEDMVFADGHHGLFETIKTPIRDGEGQITGILGVARDITDRKRAEREIERLAFYDALTELPNRRLLIDRLHQACLSSERMGHHGALLFLDLDNFKDLNDTLGHAKGDQLLVQVGRRLVKCVRQCDTVARFGGDEFVLMLEDLASERAAAAEQTERVAEKLLASMNKP